MKSFLLSIISASLVMITTGGLLAKERTFTFFHPSPFIPLPYAQTRPKILSTRIVAPLPPKETQASPSLHSALPLSREVAAALSEDSFLSLPQEELLKELDTNAKKLQEVEAWIQRQWEAYQRNPDPLLEAAKQNLYEWFLRVSEHALGFSILNPPDDKDVSPEAVERLRQTIIEASQAPDYMMLEEATILANSRAIADNLIPSSPDVLLHLAGTPLCVAPNNCFRQGAPKRGPDGKPIIGFNAFAPCCNCKCGKFDCGCLNLICPGKPAIWDACTGICGCDP